MDNSTGTFATTLNRAENMDVDYECLRNSNKLLVKERDKYRELLEQIMEQPLLNEGPEYSRFTMNIRKSLMVAIEKVLRNE